MAAVIAVLAVLMMAGVSLLNGTGPQSRKTGTDLLMGMIEQARTTAITSRCYVVLAVAEPGDIPADDGRCRLGLFKVETWPTSPSEPVKGKLLSRWQPLNSGIALIGGDVKGAANPLDQQEITLVYGTNKPLVVKVHAMAFNPRGGLHHPAGSSPMAIRIAEGRYQNGRAIATRRADSGRITENHLKIGRITARPYRTDG